MEFQYKCHCCGILYYNLRDLRKHLTHSNVASFAKNTCTFSNCEKQYASKQKFLQHVEQHFLPAASLSHINILSPPQSVQSTNSNVSFDSDLDSIPPSQGSSEPQSIQSTQSNSSLASYQVGSQNFQKFDFCSQDTSSQHPVGSEKHKLGVSFALNFHARNNFSRKDVFTMVSSCSANVVKSIVEEFKNFIAVNYGNVSTVEQRLQLAELCERIETSFFHSSSEPRLFSYL